MNPPKLLLQPLPPDELRHWVEERGVHEDILQEFKVGWTAYEGMNWVAIPIPDAEGNLLTYKLKRPHSASPEQPKYKNLRGSKATLYPVSIFRKHLTKIVLCEGEADALMLLSHGIDAITSTAGAGTFKEEWLSLFPQGCSVIFCYDLDEAGEKGVVKGLKLFSSQRPDISLSVIRLPKSLGEGADVTDFFRHCREKEKDPINHLFAFCIPFESSSKDTGEKGKKKGRPNQAQIIVETVHESQAVLFHDQLEEPYARIPVGDHDEIMKIDSQRFSRWMRLQLWKKLGKIPGSEAINSAVRLLEARGCYEGERFDLSNRVAWDGETIWYDLTDARWRAIKITLGQWEIVERPQTLFRRYNHQETQVEPQRGGSVHDVLPFVNITDPQQQLLFLVSLISFFIPGFPHIILNFYGENGSAKTTIFKIMRRLVDPSKTEVRSFPRERNDLIQELSHQWFIPYDNISYLSEDLSDALCRAVTGEGASKRALYSNDEDVLYAFQRCIALCGINIAVQKSDLFDRLLLFKLQRIPDDKRREEREVLSEFEVARPRILGAIFDTVAKAMALREFVDLKRKPRMADFAVWGCAIAEALGFTQEEFIRAYYANIGQQHEEVMDSNPVATAIQIFVEERMRDKEEWRGTATVLMKELEEMANFEDGKIHRKSLPKTPQQLTKRLNELRNNFAEFGIIVTMLPRTGRSRGISIRKAPQNAVTAVTSSQDDGTGPVQQSLLSEEASPKEVPSESHNDSGVAGDDIPPPSGNALKNLGFFKKP